MNKFRTFLLFIAFGMMGVEARAGFQAITIYNTGVKDDGSVLASGALDTHYKVSTTVGASQNAYAIGTPDPAWVPNNSTSRWINTLGTASPQDNGHFLYSTTFNLAGLDPTTATLVGRITADDQVSVLLNGSSAGVHISLSGTNYGNATPDFAYPRFYDITITGGFQAGLNTLTFDEQNLHNGPAGFRLEIAGTANAVPEPASLAMTGVGLAAAGLVARRRRRAI